MRDAQGLADNPPARCPGCRRATNADMLVDTRHVPDAIWLHEFACDGCRERLFALEVVSREAFFRYIGAPMVALDKIRAKEALRAARHI